MISRGSLVLCLAAVGALPAHADDIATDRFRPALDARALLDVEGADVGHHLDGGAALWLAWDHQALQSVDHRAIARITGSLSLFDYVALAAEVPAVLTRGALGDARVLVKVQALRAATHLLDVALAAGVTVPTAADGAFVGEHAFTFAPEVLIGRAFGDLRVNAQGGVVVRPEVTFRGEQIGSEARLRAGAGHRIPSWPLVVEATASLALPMYTAQTTLDGIAAEALLGARLDLPLHFPLQVVGFVGLGLGAAVGTPTARAGLALVASFDGPAPAPSASPAAPTMKRAVDPFVSDAADHTASDTDSDTDDDADRDTGDGEDTEVTEGADDPEIADAETTEAPAMAFDDEDEVVSDDDIVFTGEIAFAPGTADFAASAAGQLDEVAALWRALALDLEVAGGTDADPALTEQRKEAVRLALADRGVTAMLVAGAERPLTSLDAVLLVARAQH